MLSTHGDRIPRLNAIPKSRFCLWLFLSTEVMFFVALIGSYLVLRFGVPPTEWPSPTEVGLVPWIGGLNTLVLLLSSYFMTRSVGLASRDNSGQAKFFVVVAIVLGCVFLSIKSYEYWEKYRLGLFPRPRSPLIYPHYDVDYLSAVREEIIRTRGDLERKLAAGSLAQSDSRIELLNRLQLGLVAWTSREYGQSESADERDFAIRAVAHMIRPMAATAVQLEQGLQEQADRLSLERDALVAAKQELEDDLDRAIQEFRNLEGDPAAANQRAELEQKLAQLRVDLTEVNNSRSMIDDRLKLLELRSDATAGLNASYNLRLPTVVPGGRTWLYGYYLLTGVHAMHLLAGILVTLVLLPLTLNRHLAVLVGNIALYWNFVDAVWLVLFPIIYLL